MSDFDGRNVCNLEVQGAQGLGKESSGCTSLTVREVQEARGSAKESEWLRN